MQAYRIFAYVTMILVLSLLVLVTTQGLFVFIQAGDPRTWLVLLMLLGIYLSVSYGVSRRFARKPMRPPTIPLITGVLMVIPPLGLNLFVENDILYGVMYWSYIFSITIGSSIGSWLGMKAGWMQLIQSVQAEKDADRG
jgi:uncharacterized membrane protein YfcA